MTEQAYNIYEQIIAATNSELILFFIVAALFTLPLYVIVLSGKKAARKHSLERENLNREERKQMVTLLINNTEAMTGLAGTLERIHKRIDEQGQILNRLGTDVAQLNVVSQANLLNKMEKETV